MQSIVIHDTTNRTLSLTGSAYTDAIVDTGSTLISGPSDVIDSIFQGVNGSVKGETINTRLQGYWAVRKYQPLLWDSTIHLNDLILPILIQHVLRPSTSRFSFRVTYR